MTNKTIPNDNSVEQFLSAVEDEQKRKDSFTMLQLMKQITGLEPKMWGPSIIGFGSYHYKYASGREGETIMVGFSPRKQNLTLYTVGAYKEFDEQLKQLGKHTRSKGCLYIKRLDDISLPILKSIVEETFKHTKQLQDSSRQY